MNVKVNQPGEVIVHKLLPGEWVVVGVLNLDEGCEANLLFCRKLEDSGRIDWSPLAGRTLLMPYGKVATIVGRMR